MFLVGEMRAAAAADLVVEDDWDGVGAGEVGEGEEVVVRDAGTAVEDDEGGCGGGGGCGTVDLVPGFGVFVGGGNGEGDFSFCGSCGGGHGGWEVDGEERGGRD